MSGCIAGYFYKGTAQFIDFKKDSKFSTWLYSITYNYCIDVIRKDGKHMTESIDDTKAGSQLADINNIEEQKLLEIKLNDLIKFLMQYR